MFEIILRGHSGCVNAMRYSRDGRYIATGGADCHIFIWDLQGQNKVKKIKKTEPINALEWSPDGKYIVYSNFSGMVSICDVETGNDQTLLPKVDDPVIRWSPDGKYIALSERDSITIVDSNGQPLTKLYPNCPTKVEWLENNRHLLSDSGSVIDIFETCFEPVIEVRNIYKILPSISGTLSFVNENGIIVRTIGNNIQRWDWSLDKRQIATTNGDQNIIIWNTRDIFPLFRFENFVLVNGFKFDPRLINKIARFIA